MQRSDIPVELLFDIKNYLNITWDDEGTDANIRSFIGSSIAYLNKKGGGELDYISDGDPRTLLFERVRYMRDSALDVFENNYRSLILAMQNERLVKNGGMESTKSAES